MTALGKKTEYPILLRKHILSHILRFRSDVTKAVRYRKFSNKCKEDQISGTYFPNHKYFKIIISFI